MAGTLSKLTRFLRYRFLLFAGLLPYLLGTSLAYHLVGRFDALLFFSGLGGLIFALMGVEALNEYFDWQLGTDRVFQQDSAPVTARTLLAGLGAFLVAFLFAGFLTWRVGIPILAISLAGFCGAFFYLGPPLRLAYRGLGEATIALSYGPLMMLGSFYLQTQEFSVLPILVSSIPALLLFAIAILNEVPDYYQDRLVGKRNLCVRLGREGVVRLYGLVMIAGYVFLVAGLLLGMLPMLSILGLGTIPICLLGNVHARRSYDNPSQFAPAIRYLLIQYVLVVGILALGYWSQVNTPTAEKRHLMLSAAPSPFMLFPRRLEG